MVKWLLLRINLYAFYRYKFGWKTALRKALAHKGKVRNKRGYWVPDMPVFGVLTIRQSGVYRPFIKHNDEIHELAACSSYGEAEAIAYRHALELWREDPYIVRKVKGKVVERRHWVYWHTQEAK